MPTEATHHPLRSHLRAVPPQDAKVQAVPDQQDGRRGRHHGPHQLPHPSQLQQEQQVACHPHCHADAVAAQEPGVDPARRAGRQGLGHHAAVQPVPCHPAVHCPHLHECQPVVGMSGCVLCL